VFQSSPARGGGCNRSIATTASQYATGFNPHPPVGAGATRVAVKDGIPVSWNYYPDLPSRAALRDKAVDELLLDPK